MVPAMTKRFIVGIPTVGRAEILARTVARLEAQTRLPDLVLVSVAEDADAAALDGIDTPFPVRVLTGPKGATFQRNRILAECRRDDILLLIDDDFLLAPDYIAQTLRLFDRHPDAALLTGTVLFDGILGPGLDHPGGDARLAEGLTRPAEDTLTPRLSGYGCNMALRMAPVLDHGLTFDEALPLYSWLEDVDFSARLRPHGRVLRAGAMRGVHLGTKAGRTPGVRLGYSQVVNPVYLRRKGTMGRKHARDMILRALASNGLRSLRPPPWVDYRGRFRGNLLALADLVRGRAAPDRILNL
ncbi:glycosyltransferase [Rhodobacteraceae bacterium CCMM004]|nr:glycosyltransferase [Rhodobacteraceae bacterium CCMM004]